MEYFRRVLKYVFPQYKLIIISVLCAVVVAVLFSLSIAAMLPLMKIMIEEEGPHGWVHRAIVKDRSGITFRAVDLEDTIAETQLPDRPLLVTGIEKDSLSASSGLSANDVILAVVQTAQPEQGQNSAKMLARIALADADKPLRLFVRDIDGLKKTIDIQLDQPPFYTASAQWLLGFVPRDRGTDFKRDCIILIIVVILVATIIRCVLRFIQEYLVRKVSYRSITALRRDAYSQTIRLPLGYFSQEGISDTMSRFVQDSNRVHIGITTLFGKTVREPFKIVALAIAAFKINTDMTLIVLMGAPPAAFVIGKLGKKMKRATKRTLTSWSRMLGHLQETLSGLRVVKGYHREQHEEANFALINDKLLKQQYHLARIDAAGGPLLEVMGITAACVGMIFAAYWLTKGQMKTSDFLIIVMLLGTLAESGRKMGDVYTRLQAADASAQRVYKLMDAPVESDPPQAVELPRLSQLLEMRNVSFRYPGSPMLTLDNINLTVKAGETIAIVGPNGSGKTTLTSLIPRFFLCDEGEIIIDGINTEQATLSSLRRQIGIVTQRTVAFNNTIAANIAYGRLEATQDEIVTAAKRSYAHEFIEETAQGYQTIVGEQGSTLSGGQLQRIAIARAILRDPAILIFDEAMSQIDADSEAKIQRALAEFSKDRTSFIIAHRLSTIIDADRIIVLDKGKIIAQGKHLRLLKECKLYRQLYEVQFGKTKN